MNPVAGVGTRGDAGRDSDRRGRRPGRRDDGQEHNPVFIDLGSRLRMGTPQGANMITIWSAARRQDAQPCALWVQWANDSLVRYSLCKVRARCLAARCAACSPQYGRTTTSGGGGKRSVDNDIVHFTCGHSQLAELLRTERRWDAGHSPRGSTANHRHDRTRSLELEI